MLQTYYKTAEVDLMLPKAILNVPQFRMESVERSLSHSKIFDHASSWAKNFVCPSFCSSIRGRNVNFYVSFTHFNCRFDYRMGLLSFAGVCRRYVIK